MSKADADWLLDGALTNSEYRACRLCKELRSQGCKCAIWYFGTIYGTEYWGVRLVSKLAEMLEAE